MKLTSLLVCSAFALLALPAAVFAQGVLTPPGAPAPTMRTLEQLGMQLDDAQRRVELRIVVGSETTPGDETAVYRITRPGSYVLRENIEVPMAKSGIVIASSDVSLDLNGYTVVGQMGSFCGIQLLSDGGLTPTNNVRVGNGSIHGTGVGGVMAAEANNFSLHDLQVSDVADAGIYFSGLGGRVERVRTYRTNGAGIDLRSRNGLVADCTVDTVRGAPTEMYGIRAGVVRGCMVRGVADEGMSDAWGISAEVAEGCRVDGVSATHGGSTGIAATVVENCTVANISSSNLVAGKMLQGILATTVRGSSVDTIGTGTAIAVWGIRADTVEGCSAATISGKDPVGIDGGSGTVRSSRVYGMTGASGTTTLYGIRAGEIIGCTATMLTSPASAHGLHGTNIVDSISGEISALTPSGIVATASVRDCQAYSITATAGATSTYGINASGAVSGCMVNSIASASANTYGIYGATVRGCRVYAIATGIGSGGTACGIGTTLAGVVENNSLQLVRSIGIQAGQGSLVRENAIFNVGGVTGVADGKAIVGLQGSRIEGNTIGGDAPDYGIFVSGTGCVIVGNHCNGTFTGASTGAGLSNTGAYNVVLGNRLGEIVTGGGLVGATVGANANFAN